MSNIKVSVIVPVFNVAAYLGECLDSVLAQTLGEIEILCGDGGSTDGSLEILQEYAKKDSRIRYISKKGSGYGQSVNECMDMAQGEYIGIVESDDVIRPNTYEVLYGLAQKNGLDWIRGDIYYYYSGIPDSKQLKRESIIYGGDFYNMVIDPQTDYRPYKSGLRTWSGIYRTAFLNENGIRHNETPGGSYQDVGFYLKTLYYARRVYFVDQAFYLWRQDNPGSSVHYNSAKLVEKSLKEWQLNQEYLDQHPGIGKRATASYHYRKFFSYLWTEEMAEGDDKITVQRAAAEEFTNALQKGEIDKGFFETWEWDRFLETLKRWQDIAAEARAQGSLAATEGKPPQPSFSVKRSVKRFLKPLVGLIRKVVYVLMRNVLFALENEIGQVYLRVNETAGDTQWQVRESAAELRQAFDRIFPLMQTIQASTEKNARLLEELECRMEVLERKPILEPGQAQLLERIPGLCGAVSSLREGLSRQAGVLQEVQSCCGEMNQNTEGLREQIGKQAALLHDTERYCADIHGTVSETRQKVLDQGDTLWNVKSRCEDIHETVSETRQKVLDQGDALWNVKSRCEDIHEAVSETRQKVLDQGDVLWKTKDRIEDVCTVCNDFLVHPDLGEGEKKHFAVRSVLSLMRRGDEQYNKEICRRFLNQVEIETFSKCNRKCWFCPNKMIDRQSHNFHMEESIYLKILSELRELKYAAVISFSRYNEPLADPVIFERIRQAREYCPDAWLRLNTNGDYLTADVLARIAEAGLNEMEIQYYPEQGVPLHWDGFGVKLLELTECLGIPGYEILIEDPGNRYLAKFNYPNMKLTCNALNMEKLSNNRGESLKGITPDYQRTTNCLVPFRNLYIDYNGSYMMCCNVRSDIPEHEPYIVGNAETERIFDVFTGEKLIAVRKMAGVCERMTVPCNSCQYLTQDHEFPIF